MKNLISILIVILFCSTPTIAQDVIRQSACTQASILQQADSIKKELEGERKRNEDHNHELHKQLETEIQNLIYKITQSNFNVEF